MVMTPTNPQHNALQKPSRLRLRPVLVAAIAILVVGGLGGALTTLGPWYYGLEQPAFKPPDWAFGPAWTLIFLLSGYAGVTAWAYARNPLDKQAVLLLFGLNAVFNVGWSALFFYLKRPDLALYEVGLLWFSIVLLIGRLRKLHPHIGPALAPYLLWVTFAAALNVAIVQLNGPFS